MGDSGGPKGLEFKEVRLEKPRNIYRHCAICHRRRHRHPGTTVRVVRRRGRGSARPGALSFHLCSAPSLKAPRSATPGDARVGRKGGGVGGKKPRTLSPRRFC